MAALALNSPVSVMASTGGASIARRISSTSS
jgi:hypothetical protein